MIHQLRIYEIFERNKAAFHARFRDHAMRIMARYGFVFVATWEAKADRRTEFVYLLSWPDVATKRATNAEHGDLVGEIQDRVLVPTAYAPKVPIA